MTSLATKSDLSDAGHLLKVDFEKALHRQTWGLVGVIFAQGAFIIVVLHLLQKLSQPRTPYVFGSIAMNGK